MKRAMILLHRRLIERGLSSSVVLQIHDEVDIRKKSNFEIINSFILLPACRSGSSP